MQVYYFTRTGNSKHIANQIACSHNLKALEISDAQNWSGIRNFIRAGAMATMREVLPISYPAVNPLNSIILVFPIWAGTLPPAVRSFLEHTNANRITAVVLSAHSSLNFTDSLYFANVFQIKGKQFIAPPDLL